MGRRHESRRGQPAPRARRRAAYPGLRTGRRPILGLGRGLEVLKGRITEQAGGNRRTSRPVLGFGRGSRAGVMSVCGRRLSALMRLTRQIRRIRSAGYGCSVLDAPKASWRAPRLSSRTQEAICVCVRNQRCVSKTNVSIYVCPKPTIFRNQRSCPKPTVCVRNQRCVSETNDLCVCPKPTLCVQNQRFNLCVSETNDLSETNAAPKPTLCVRNQRSSETNVLAKH